MGDANSNSNPLSRNGYDSGSTSRCRGCEMPDRPSARPDPNTPGHVNKPHQGTRDLNYLFATIRRHKWVIIIFTALFTILGGLYASMRMPIYRSAGTMMIKQSRNQYSMAGSDLRGLLSSSYGLGIGSTMANELQVLKSGTLSREIALRMHELKYAENGRLFPSLWRGYPVDPTLTSVDTTAMRIRGSLEVAQVGEIGWETDIVQIGYLSPSRHEARQVVDLAMEVYSDLSTQKTRELAGSALSFLTREKRELRKRLRVAEDSLNRFMKQHRFVHVETQTVELIQSIADLESRKQEIHVKRGVAESGIGKYRAELERIKPGHAGLFSDAIGPKMQRYQYEMAELETQRLLMKTKNPRIMDTGYPEWNQLDERISVVREEIDNLSENVMEKGDPFAVALGGESGAVSGHITNLYKKLFDLRLKTAQYEAHTLALNDRLHLLNSEFEHLPDHMTQLARLKRELKTAEQLFLTVSKQTSETAFWEQTRIGKGIPIDSAYLPQIPVQPYTQLFALIGFVIGSLCSASWIIIYETINTRIDGEEALKSYPHPVLTVVPDIKEASNKAVNGITKIPFNGYYISASLISLLDSKSPSAEAFRRLHHNILHTRPGRPAKTLTVTSSSKEEGKTSVISNLAVILAKSGKRVLLLDMDLRRPSVHRMFGIPALGHTPAIATGTSKGAGQNAATGNGADSGHGTLTGSGSRKSHNNGKDNGNSSGTNSGSGIAICKGITDVILEGCDLQKAIHPTAVERLYILPCGKQPASTSSLSHSTRLSEMIRALQQNEEYDHILIDTAPYGLITDAGPLLELSDRVLLVARFGFTERAHLSRTIENLQRIEAPVAGTVLTAFNHRKSRDSYDSRGYYREVYKDYRRYQRDEGG